MSESDDVSYDDEGICELAAEYEPQPDDCVEDEPHDMTDAEADADTLKSCGWGTDEDHGDYGGSE